MTNLILCTCLFSFHSSTIFLPNTKTLKSYIAFRALFSAGCVLLCSKPLSQCMQRIMAEFVMLLTKKILLKTWTINYLFFFVHCFKHWIFSQDFTQFIQSLLHFRNSCKLGFQSLFFLTQWQTDSGVQLLETPATLSIKLQQVSVVLPAAEIKTLVMAQGTDGSFLHANLDICVSFQRCFSGIWAVQFWITG